MEWFYKFSQYWPKKLIFIREEENMEYIYTYKYLRTESNIHTIT